MGFLTTGGVQSPLDRQVSSGEFSSILRDRFAEDLKYESTCGLADRSPAESARSIAGPLAPSPTLILAILFAIGVTAAFPKTAAASAIIATTVYFLVVSALRVGLAVIARPGPRNADRLHLRDDDLPVVTILAPLFREAHALPGLVRAINGLDYPPDKIDVKLLLEEHDEDTLGEALRLNLDHHFDLMVIPQSFPQTKPKACNYGLQCAKGDLIVIYDAEDEPENDQLRIAAEIFAAGDERLACVQARLNYYNADDNLLTRLFTLEYCLWFDHFLPALDRLGAPVPLGGTSNIFRTEILEELGGWDPYNVTEDADLGLRLARRGFRTAVTASTTFEEANCRTSNWMRQRSRWMKGFMQTWLVHRRNLKGQPVDWRSIVSVDLFVGGTAFAALINPLLWIALAAERVGLYSPLGDLSATATALNIGALAIGNFSFLALAAYAPLARGLGRLSPAALLMPIYWIMMSVAAWRALYQLATRPSYWEKTDHGLSAEAKTRRRAALRSFGLEQDAATGHFAPIASDVHDRGGMQFEAPTE